MNSLKKCSCEKSRNPQKYYKECQELIWLDSTATYLIHLLIMICATCTNDAKNIQGTSLMAVFFFTFLFFMYIMIMEKRASCSSEKSVCVECTFLSRQHFWAEIRTVPIIKQLTSEVIILVMCPSECMQSHKSVRKMVDHSEYIHKCKWTLCFLDS